MTWQYSNYANVLFVTTIFAIIASAVVWQRRASPGGIPFALLTIALAEWTLTTALEMSIVEIPAKIFWSKFQYVGVSVMSILWVLYAAAYSRQQQWLTRRLVTALWIIPTITIFLAATNESHHLLWSDITPASNVPGDYLLYSHGTWYWIAAMYNYVLVAFGMFVVLRATLQFPKIYLRQSLGLLLSAAIAWIGGLTDAFGLGPVRGVEITPLAATLACIIYAFTLFRSQLLDLAPIARDKLIENMNDGVIVLDAHNRIVDLNPAARQLIGGDAASPSQTKDIEEALNKRFDLVTRYKNITTEARDTIGINENPPRYYDARISPLRDKDGHLTGRMIVLRDVSNLKQIEVEVMNQAQLVAERLAELETIYDITQASASRLKLNALLEFVGEKILQTFKVQVAFVALYDKQENVLRFPYWQAYDERLNQAPSPFGQGLSAIIIRTKQSLVINNNYQQRSAELGAVRVANSHGTTPKAWAGVPMIVGDEVIGILSAQDHERENVFTDSKIQLLTTIAANVSIAFQNAQLYEATQQRAAELQDLHKEAEARVKELASINAIGQAAASHLEINSLLELVGEKIYKIFEAQAIYIALYDEASGLIHIPYWQSPEGRHDHSAIRLGEGLTSVIISSGQPLLIDHDYERRSAELGVIRVPSASSNPPKSWLGVPLRLGDKIIGVLGVQDFNKEYAYNATDMRLLSAITVNVGIAIQNAQLYEATQQREAEVRRANEQLRVQLAEIEALQTQLREQAIRDPLTGLFNRRYLIETLDREVAQAVRASTPLSIIMIDLDYFKKINDTYGHKAGDVMLQTLGTLLATKTRDGDIACRYGGEEFIIVLPGASQTIAQRRAEQMRSTFEELRLTYGGHILSATLSAGVAEFPLNGVDGESVLQDADKALYIAKSLGRNRVVVSETASV